MKFGSRTIARELVREGRTGNGAHETWLVRLAARLRRIGAEVEDELLSGSPAIREVEDEVMAGGQRPVLVVP